jgi:hypothetical protein
MTCCTQAARASRRYEQRGERFAVVLLADALLPRSAVIVAPTSPSASRLSRSTRNAARHELVASSELDDAVAQLTMVFVDGTQSMATWPAGNTCVAANSLLMNTLPGGVNVVPVDKSVS